MGLWEDLLDEQTVIGKEGPESNLAQDRSLRDPVSIRSQNSESPLALKGARRYSTAWITYAPGALSDSHEPSISGPGIRLLWIFGGSHHDLPDRTC